jgi:RsiW-degrading membrane proteinase PrsW (M82 family)
MKNRRLVVPFALAAILLAWAVPALADEPLPQDDLALAQRYAPVLYFHPAEVFRPQPVDVIVDQARLRQSRRLWFDVNVLLHLNVPELLNLPSDKSYFLDVWFGDSGSSAYTNYSAHQAYYQAVLRPEAGGPPVTAYAHVVRERGRTTIQYWLLYFYNDWFNKHEGDWEMVQVMLGADGEPEWVVLSQHHGGTRRAWAAAPVEEGTHPAAYVARGSHANYFAGDEVYPNGKDVGHTRIEILDRTGSAYRTIPEVILIPTREQVLADPATWPGAEWLPYRGHWGQMTVQADFSGPLGPADKGPQWETPYEWGLAQPLDTDVWYANRLRVEVVGAVPGEAQVRLMTADGRALPAAEELGNLAFLHGDPPTSTQVIAALRVPPNTAWDIAAAWPDPVAGTVTRYRFADVGFDEAGSATLTFDVDGNPAIVVGSSGAALPPAEAETTKATWDAPDLVWIGTILPAHQVMLGLLIVVLASVLPTLLYVGALYWVDRYEKEPKRLLAAAFLWGAIPSVLLAVVAELFFRLPPDLIGPQALEAVRLGLVAPLLEETLKGAAVLFVAWRYRREFDDVLDGIIYGAMVGFGFAMTGNLLSYAGSFLLWGFEGLNTGSLAEGVVYALNHALYTGIFGATLGYARLAQKPWQRRAVPVGGFLLAVLAHALHGFLAHSVVGLNALTVATTGIGLLLIGVVVVWALGREQRCLRAELRDTIPGMLYQAIITPRGRTHAQWRALRSGGLRVWWRTRRLHQLCAELAFKRMQARLHLDEPEMAHEASALQAEIEALFAGR